MLSPRISASLMMSKIWFTIASARPIGSFSWRATASIRAALVLGMALRCNRGAGQSGSMLPLILRPGQALASDVSARDDSVRSFDGAEIKLRWFERSGAQPGSAALDVHGGGMVALARARFVKLGLIAAPDSSPAGIERSPPSRAGITSSGPLPR
jgi:hypothetical protein